MRSTNRKRALIVSAAVILLCMTIIVGMTWALFTDTAEVENHLQAGDLNITLERIQLDTKSLDAKGYLATKTSTEIVNFSTTRTDKRNMFDLGEGAKIVPGSSYTATMRISNNRAEVGAHKLNSDVAYDYWIEIKLDVTGLKAEEIEALKLDEQLKVTVNSELLTKAEYAFLNAGLKVGSEQSPIGTLALGEYDDFTVTVEFVDSSSNNAAKTQSLKFDVIVYAVQRTTAPTP